MDKVILVFYIGVKDLSKEVAKQWMQKLSAQIQADKDCKNYIIPIPNSNEIKVECINPKLVSQEEFNQASLKLSQMNAFIDTLLNEPNIQNN